MVNGDADADVGVVESIMMEGGFCLIINQLTSEMMGPRYYNCIALLDFLMTNNVFKGLEHVRDTCQ
jgi:hypothetical protein